MLDEDQIAKFSQRKARVGNQMLYEVAYSFGVQVYVNGQYLDMSFDEAVLRASAGERLWQSWI